MTNPKGGRPRKTIDWGTFDKLCAFQCTGEEIAAWFGIDYDTLNNICKREMGAGFTECFEQKRSLGKVSLRRAQFQNAMGGNPTMQIWLGKNWLGQTDQLTLENQHSGTVGITEIALVAPDES